VDNSCVQSTFLSWRDAKPLLIFDMISFTKKFILTAFLICSFHSPVQATEQYGLSMVGKPMMPENFTHFNYSNPNAPKGGTLRQAIIGNFDTLNPFSLKGTAAQNLNLVYDRLMIRSWDEPFTLYPLIAESVYVPDDRSSITFTLNPKAKFQDGTAITSDDVLYSFQTLKDNGRPNMRNIYKLVAKVDKINSQKIKFTLSDERTNETVMILAMMPILSQKWWANQDLNKTILTPPNSTGPYIIKEVEIGRRIVMERNPNYWAKDLPVAKGQYNFDRIIFNYFKNQTTAFESFKSGDTDIWIDTNPGHWANSYDFPAVINKQVKREEIKHGRVEKMWGFIFNSSRPPFDNRDVRKALSLTIDYNWINKNIFYGQYNILTSYFPNSHLAAIGLPSEEEISLLLPFKSSLSPDVFLNSWKPPKTGDQKSLRANLIEADKLLTQSGWVIKDKIRTQVSTGKEMNFEILVGAVDEEKIALSFKRSLARLGINVRIRTLDAAAFQSRLSDYDYDMMLYNWQNTLSPGTEQAIYWGCASAKEKGRFNYAQICNPAIDSLVAQIPDSKTTSDMQARVRALDRILMSENYTIPLFYTGRDFVASWTWISRPSTPSLYGNIMESWWFSGKINNLVNRD
jgi:microcin C transport system substrate-binding protein